MEKVKVKLEGVEETMKKLKKLDDRLKKRIIKKVGKKSLPPMVDSYQKNITDADEVFKVYREGKIVYEIMPGQLRRSVGIKSPKASAYNSSCFTPCSPPVPCSWSSG